MLQCPQCDGWLLTLLTFPSEPHLEALLQSAVLALVAVVLVYRAVAVTAALVLKIPPHRPLEEALAA